MEYTTSTEHWEPSLRNQHDWKTTWEANSKLTEQVTIKWIIYQRDALSLYSTENGATSSPLLYMGDI